MKKKKIVNEPGKIGWACRLETNLPSHNSLWCNNRLGCCSLVLAPSEARPPKSGSEESTFKRLT